MIHSSKGTIKPIQPGTGRQIDHLVCKGGKLMSQVQYESDDFQISALVPFVGKEEFETAPVPRLQSGLPKIQWDSEKGGVIQCYNYFAAVHQKLSSEAFVWWHWDRESKEYLMVVPAFYYASAGSLHYEVSTHFCKRCQVGLMDGHMHCPHCGDKEDIQPLNILGTSHSHGTMAPFHSATDHANELDTTGFHITFGHLQNGPVVHVAGSFVVAEAKHRFDTSWSDHFDFQQSEHAIWRLNLWLTLVASSNSMKGSYYVEDSKGRKVYAGTQEHCSRWVANLVKYNNEAYVIKKDTPVYKYQHGGYKNGWLSSGKKTGRTNTNKGPSTITSGKDLGTGKKIELMMDAPSGCDADIGEAATLLASRAPDYIIREAVIYVYAVFLRELFGVGEEEALNAMFNLAPGDESIEEINSLRMSKGDKPWVTIVVDKLLDAIDGEAALEPATWAAELLIGSFEGLTITDRLIDSYRSHMWDALELAEAWQNAGSSEDAEEASFDFTDVWEDDDDDDVVTKEADIHGSGYDEDYEHWMRGFDY